MSPRAASAAPKLSICIITYNRAEYLRRALHALLGLEHSQLDCEIIVFDNCSSDATAAVISEISPQLVNLRYYRQNRTVDAEDNLIAAFRLARGAYAVYLADDDALILDNVASTIAYMEENPTLVACHSPWELWDNVDNRSQGLFYAVDKPTQFAKQDMLGLFDFVIQRHIFPEIGIYRTAMLHKILYRPRNAYWAYVFLARALEYGDVAFLPTPFYRSITRHWEGEVREQHGHQQALSQWDLYRGGIEYLLQRALGGADAGQNDLERWRKDIHRFVASRMKVALRLLIGKQDYIGACDVLARLLPWDYVRPQDVEQYRQWLPIRAAAQAIIATFDAVSTLRQIGLYQIAASAKLVTLLHKIRKDLPIVELSAADLAHMQSKDQTLAITRDAADRLALIEAGYAQGLVVAEPDLLAQFRL